MQNDSNELSRLSCRCILTNEYKELRSLLDEIQKLNHNTSYVNRTVKKLAKSVKLLKTLAEAHASYRHDERRATLELLKERRINVDFGKRKRSTWAVGAKNYAIPKNVRYPSKRTKGRPHKRGRGKKTNKHSKV